VAVGGRGSRAAVRWALRRVCARADVVHAFGLVAGREVAAVRPRAVRRWAGVLTMSRAWVPGEDAALPLARAVGRGRARRAVRSVDVVLGATPGAVGAARSLGASDARLAPAVDGVERGVDDAVAQVLSVYDELVGVPVE
jgi:hypothetical protein